MHYPQPTYLRLGSTVNCLILVFNIVIQKNFTSKYYSNGSKKALVYTVLYSHYLQMEFKTLI